jgi:hypothetical protein
VEDQSTPEETLKEDNPKNPRAIGPLDQDLQMRILMILGQIVDLKIPTMNLKRLVEHHREETLEEDLIYTTFNLQILGLHHQQSSTLKAKPQSGNRFSRWKSGSKPQESSMT